MGEPGAIRNGILDRATSLGFYLYAFLLLSKDTAITLPVTFPTAGMIAPFLFLRRPITRAVGIGFIAIYAAYVAVLMTAGG